MPAKGSTLNSGHVSQNGTGGADAVQLKNLNAVRRLQSTAMVHLDGDARTSCSRLPRLVIRRPCTPLPLLFDVMSSFIGACAVCFPGP